MLFGYSILRIWQQQKKSLIVSNQAILICYKTYLMFEWKLLKYKEHKGNRLQCILKIFKVSQNTSTLKWKSKLCGTCEHQQSLL